MSPILTILACDRAGCQHHSNGDEVSWWAIAEPIEGKLNLVPFEESMKSTEDGFWKFYCGQACAIAEVSEWMGKQHKES